MSNAAYADFFEYEDQTEVLAAPTEIVMSQSPKAQRREQRKAEKAEKQNRRNPKPLQPRTKSQAVYVESLTTNELTFGVGPAGVGKTYVPAYVYGQMLVRGEIEKLYLARPNVSKKKHQNGFLPGTLEEKTAPWLVPIYDGLKDAMGPSDFDKFKRDKKIEEVPYEYMQGRTFKNAAAIVDEAENLDLDDLYITLTRQGENLLMCLCGDIYQSRIPNSGLAEVIDMADEYALESVGVVRFASEDIVRSRQAKQWALAFERRNCLHFAPKGDSFATSPDTLPDFLKGGR